MITTSHEFTSDWFSHNAGKWLAWLSDYVGRPDVRYLEIGSYEGRSVVWMFENILTGANTSAVCIDVWKDPAVANRFDSNVSKFNVAKRVGDSFLELIGMYPSEQFDIIYIDGSHEARDIFADAAVAFRLLKNRGILIFDDYHWYLPGRVDVFPKVAIDGFLAAYAPVIEVFEVGYQVALRKKESVRRINLNKHSANSTLMANSLDVSSEWPLISCVMPTYGRPDYVPEAVGCFLEQDYPHKELIILNDCAGQVFVGDIPGVRIVNLDERYPMLGDKRNASIAMADGELIAVWDDDDLSLPWRLSFSWQEMQRHHTNFYRPAEFLAYWGETKLHDNQSVPAWVSHGTVCFTKKLWAEVGGYPSAGVGEDARFFKGIHQYLREDFIKYPIAHSDRFYILRGTSQYKHMSIDGGERPLNCSPGTFPIRPQGISDELLRSAWEAVKNAHGIHAPRARAVPESAGAAPVLSVCMAVKNRSRIVHKHRLLDLLPRTVRTLSDAARKIGPLELVIADFSSTDWPLREWLSSGGNLTVNIVDAEGDFSRGRGLNIAARHAKSDRLFLTDADVLVQTAAIQRGLSSLERGVTRFPIFKYLDIHGREQHWEDFTKGLVFVTREQLLKCGGVPEFKSWGGEDDIFFEAIKSEWPVQRERDDGLRHQWHPESARHENYVNPRKSDYRRFQQSNVCNSDRLELLATLAVEHCEWVGPVRQIHLYKNGFMERPGLGCGSYELVPQERLTLNWNHWPAEDLFWDAQCELYRHRSKSFTARIVDASCDLSTPKRGEHRWKPHLGTPGDNEEGIVKAAIIGLFNSGSSAVAQIVDALGFNLGPPFWHTHFESKSLRSHLVKWWREPQLVEQVPQAERIPVLKRWLEHYACQNELVCAKHPLLCLSAVDLPLAWGAGVKYIRTNRDLEESIAKLDARGWFMSAEDPHPARRIQTTLWRAVEQFFASHDHLSLDYHDLISNPRREIERLAEYLGVSPTEDQIVCAVSLVKQPKQHSPGKHFQHQAYHSNIVGRSK